jgi:hypothetical protein
LASMQNTGGGLTRWGSGPDHDGSNGLEPQDQGFVAHWYSPMVWMKLAIVVGDVG